MYIFFKGNGQSLAKSYFDVLELIVQHIQTKALKELNLNNHGHRSWI
jgi:hypothetical protein